MHGLTPSSFFFSLIGIGDFTWRQDCPFARRLAMTFSDLDPILDPWCKRRCLFKHTRMLDSEIRGIEIVDDAGDVYHMSIMPTDYDFTIVVGISDRKKKRSEYRTSIGLLEETLENAYSKIESWMAMRGHTRTAC